MKIREPDFTDEGAGFAFLDELPPLGSRILTSKGQGKVLAQEVLARKVLAEFEDGRRVVVALNEILTRLG